MSAPLPGEPRAPGGVSVSGLHAYLVATFGANGEAFFQWLAVEHPTWARSLAERLQKAQTECAAAEASE